MAMLVFSAVGLLLTYAIQRLQHLLPLNPDKLGAGRARSGLEHRRVVHHEHELAGLRGEATMSHFSQMVGLTFHNFASAAAGIAHRHRRHPRHRARSSAATLGNFWVDLVRAHALGPPAALRSSAAIVLLSQGVMQNFHADVEVTHARRGDAEDPAGAGGVAGSDQGARHERRRLLQRQLRAPLREPHALHEPLPDVPHPLRSRPASPTRSAR